MINPQQSDPQLGVIHCVSTMALQFLNTFGGKLLHNVVLFTLKLTPRPHRVRIRSGLLRVCYVSGSAACAISTSCVCDKFRIRCCCVFNLHQVRLYNPTWVNQSWIDVSALDLISNQVLPVINKLALKFLFYKTQFM